MRSRRCEIPEAKKKAIRKLRLTLALVTIGAIAACGRDDYEHAADCKLLMEHANECAEWQSADDAARNFRAALLALPRPTPEECPEIEGESRKDRGDRCPKWLTWITGITSRLGNLKNETCEPRCMKTKVESWNDDQRRKLIACQMFVEDFQARRVDKEEAR